MYGGRYVRSVDSAWFVVGSIDHFSSGGILTSFVLIVKARLHPV